MLLHEPRKNPNNKWNVWSSGSNIDKTSHKLSILGCILKFIPFFWCELQIMSHWSKDRITPIHAELVQQFSNVLLLGYEYVIWILNHFNAHVVVNMSQICHLKTCLQLFLYGCNTTFIVPCYQQIIYIYYKIYNNFSNFLDKQSCIVNIQMLEIQFQKMLS